jgi:hypothetical protein
MRRPERLPDGAWLKGVTGLSDRDEIVQSLLNIEKYLDQLIKSHAIQINTARKIRGKVQALRNQL